MADTPELMDVPKTIELRDAVFNLILEEQHRSRRMIRNYLIAGFIVLVLAVSCTLVGVGLIRHTQNEHSPIVACQSKAIDGLLKDVPLAFAGDKNAHDYSKIPHNCGVSR